MRLRVRLRPARRYREAGRPDTQEQIDDIGAYSTSSRFNDDDKLILRYAEELTTKARADDLFHKVETLVGKDKIIDLTGAIAFWNMMARNLNALQVGLEP